MLVLVMNRFMKHPHCRYAKPANSSGTDKRNQAPSRKASERVGFEQEEMEVEELGELPL